MPRVTTWSCKTCGILKGEHNSWWLVRIEAETFSVRPMHEKVWDGEDAVCGREHVQRELEIFLAGEKD